MQDMTVILGSATPVAQNIWTSTELGAALIGALVGGLVTLSATIMANRNSRKLALIASQEAERKAAKLSTFRILHTFQRLAGQIVAAHANIMGCVSKFPAETPTDQYWRIIEEIMPIHEQQAFDSNDLVILIGPQHNRLIAGLLDCEIGERHISATMNDYSTLRRELTTIHMLDIRETAPNSYLIAKDARFYMLINLAEQLVSISTLESSRLGSVGDLLLPIVDDYIPDYTEILKRQIAGIKAKTMVAAAVAQDKTPDEPPPSEAK